MGIEEKLKFAKKTKWIAEGFSDAEVKTIVELAKISARIERCRLEMKMTQKEFAEYMGVTQGMVSKWESREYNFTIRSLNEIAQKLHLDFQIEVGNIHTEKDYTIIKWDEEVIENKKSKHKWMKKFSGKEAIA